MIWLVYCTCIHTYPTHAHIVLINALHFKCIVENWFEFHSYGPDRERGRTRKRERESRRFWCNIRCRILCVCAQFSLECVPGMIGNFYFVICSCFIHGALFSLCVQFLLVLFSPSSISQSSHPWFLSFRWFIACYLVPLLFSIYILFIFFLSLIGKDLNDTLLSFVTKFEVNS